MTGTPHIFPAYTIWGTDQTGTSKWLGQYDDLTAAITDLDEWPDDFMEIVDAKGEVVHTRQRLRADDPMSFVT